MIPSILSLYFSASRYGLAKGMFGAALICSLLTGCAAFKSYAPGEEDGNTPPPPTPQRSGPTTSAIPSSTTPSPRPPPPAKSGRLPAGQHRTNDNCVTLIKESEGLRLQAYQGPSGAWLIGYGHLAGVQPGMTITAARAEAILREDLREFERNVSRLVKVNVSNNEFSAMVCLSYNIGWGAFGQSTVLRRVNQQRWREAGDAFLMWNKVNGKTNTHLVQRRKQERTLFLQ